MKKNSRIYVAGHNGLVGSSLVETLKSNGYTDIITMDHSQFDLMNNSLVEAFFNIIKPEYVFLCAAKVGGINANNIYPAEFIYNNLQIQNNIIDGCKRHKVKKLCFLGSVCFIPGTMVITSCGIKNIEDVKIGDNVLTHCGNYNKVYKTTTTPFHKEIIKIDLHGWNNIECTHNHLIYTERGFIQANELTTDDFIVIPISKSTSSDCISLVDKKSLKLWNAFIDIKNDISPKIVMDKYNIKRENSGMIYGWKRGNIPFFGYIKNESVDLKDGLSELCGYFVAEGWISGKELGSRGSSHSVCFSPGKNESFMHDINSKLKSIFGVNIRNRTLRTSFTVECNNKLVYKFFKQFYNNIDIHRAHTKYVPKFIMDSSIDSIKLFLRGYWRGDGHWEKRKDRNNNQYICSSASTSKELSYQIQQLLLKVGVFSSVYYKKKPRTCVIEHRIVNQRDQWEVRIVGNNSIKFIQEILMETVDDFVPKNKSRNTHIFYNNELRVKVKNISKSLYDGEVYDLSVENDNSYTTNGIAVHNCIYPKFAEVPVKEESLLTGLLEESNQWYAIAKIAGIKMCQAYNKQYGCNFISVMPTNLYGPNDNFNLETSHVIPALIRKFVDAKENNVPNVTCWGTGHVRREFMYVDDMTDALVFLMNNYNDPSIINIGCGIDYTIKETSELIKKIVGYDGEIIWDTSRSDGTPKRMMDSTKIFNLGWTPEINLESGLTKTIEWYKIFQNEKA